jgi:hypothetical protein
MLLLVLLPEPLPIENETDQIDQNELAANSGTRRSNLVLT